MSYLEAAAIEALLVGALAGLVGVLVVLRRRAFFATALTHSTFPGAVVAVVVGVPPALGAGVFSLALVALMTTLASVRRLGGQVASGVVLTSGFALGALLQALNPQLPIQLESFLVGSILTVSGLDLALAAAMLVLALVVVAVAGKELLFASFDAPAYRAAGYRPWIAELLTLVLIAGTVVVAMPAVGSILAIALIVGPAATVQLFARSAVGMALGAPLLGAAVGLTGLWLSVSFGVSAGGTITLLAAAIYVLAQLVTRQSTSARRRRQALEERARLGLGAARLRLRA
ncbi:metal ABC transporter permease [Ruicaihuangia caeni]|uniref:Metal ABC transporter permease n=1 Tax=Ruicaihuangia caeni TaxID=3042517 RepID=A0AAW6T5G4_9MICO|nr:metal ABC transporter permease [Klugiella sp. YN-L-19]MDI2099065.1 metal ABC transporter permease [Klugiella sp. YN-L-19]